MSKWQRRLQRQDQRGGAINKRGHTRGEEISPRCEKYHVSQNNARQGRNMTSRGKYHGREISEEENIKSRGKFHVERKKFHVKRKVLRQEENITPRKILRQEKIFTSRRKYYVRRKMSHQDVEKKKFRLRGKFSRRDFKIS